MVVPSRLIIIDYLFFADKPASVAWFTSTTNRTAIFLTTNRTAILDIKPVLIQQSYFAIMSTI